MTSPKRRGRPMKRASELTPSRQARMKRAIAVRAVQLQDQPDIAKTDPPPLTIENLPPEIIQQIFFYALEVNLPRASTSIARLLSTTAVYRALVLFAFFKPDDNLALDWNATKYFWPAEYHRLTFNERIRIQRGVLSCGWCSLEILRSCVTLLCRMKMTEQWHIESQILEEIEQHRVAGWDIQEVVSDHLLSVSSLPDLEDHVGLEEHYLVKRLERGILHFEIDAPRPFTLALFKQNDYLMYVQTWDIRLEMTPTMSGAIYKRIGPHVSFFSCNIIPDKVLVAAPWTSRKLETLKLLRKGMRSLPETERLIDVSVEGLFLGMKHAVQEENIEALLILLELYWAIDYDHDQLKPSSHRVPRPIHGGWMLHLLPSNLFHLATKARQKSSALLILLVRASVDSIPVDDDILTSWALKYAEDGDVFACWLLRYMEMLPHSKSPESLKQSGLFEGYWDDISRYPDSPPRRYLERAGQLWFAEGSYIGPPHLNSDGIFPRESFADEIGYPEDDDHGYRLLRSYRNEDH